MPLTWPANQEGLRLMNSPTIVPMTDLDALRAAGINYPASIHSWRWLYRCRHERGIADAFIRSGRRVLVNVPRYIELAQQQVA